MEQFRQDHQLPDAPWSPEQLCALHEAMQGIRHDLQGTLDRLENEIAQIEQALVRRSRIVATTLTRTYTSRLLDDQRFDTVIIDEASMALAPALFCTLALATSRVIIVGDFLQLAPIASAKTQATKHWLARSIYDIAQITSGRDPRVVPLSMQYRMHPDIANVSRRLYARAGLSYVSAPSTLTDRSQTAEAAPAPGHSLIFCNTEPAHPVTVRDAKGSPFNLYHALLAVRLAQQALSTPGHLPTVSIICPYRAQVNLIERLLRLEELDELVRVGTIHRFQGRESDVVIFDTVTTENATRSMLGWAYDDAAPHKLINVALTRAKGKLIVIGHHGALATLQHGPQPILWECIEEANANGLHLDATTILQAMTFSLHDSPIESDAVLSRVLARTTASRGQLKPVPSRLTSLVQAS
jgi:superfamily I DNA and/or RNA helicase